jgi:hypothetical protein
MEILAGIKGGIFTENKLSFYKYGVPLSPGEREACLSNQNECYTAIHASADRGEWNTIAISLKFSQPKMTDFGVCRLCPRSLAHMHHCMLWARRSSIEHRRNPGIVGLLN